MLIRRWCTARVVAVCLLVVAAAPSALAGPPSFVCSKAKTWLEKTVCASDRLSALDLELALAYARMLSALNGEAERAFTAEQRKFWVDRSNCQRDKDPVDCLQARYETRLAHIKGRPDYPGDERTARTEYTEALIKEAGKGWSQQMSVYMRAIRACVAKSNPKPRAVLNAWPHEDGQSVAMRLQTAAGEEHLCMARKDGTQPQVRKRHTGEAVPDAGPILWLGSGAPPKKACGKPIQVLDTDGTPVGWLAEGKC